MTDRSKNHSGIFTLTRTIGAVAGLLAVLVIRRNLGAEAFMANYFGHFPLESIPEPLTLEAVRSLFAVPVIGFLYFDSFDLINVLLVLLLFIPIFTLSVQSNRSFTIVSSVLLVTSFALYCFSNTGLPLFFNLDSDSGLMRILSSESSRRFYSDAALFLFYLFGVEFSVVLRRCGIFSKWTFLFGMIGNSIGILYFPLGLLIPEWNYLTIVLAAPFTVIWHGNLALNLFRLNTKKSEKSE